jgi:hypothetical protein
VECGGDQPALRAVDDDLDESQRVHPIMQGGWHALDSLDVCHPARSLLATGQRRT